MVSHQSGLSESNADIAFPILYSDLSILTQREIGVYGIFRPEEHPNVVRLVRQLIQTITEPSELAMHREILLLAQLMLELSLLSLERPPYPRSGSRRVLLPDRTSRTSCPATNPSGREDTGQ